MNTSVRNHSNRLDSNLPLRTDLGGQPTNDGVSQQGAATTTDTAAGNYQQASPKIGRRYSFDDNGGGYQGL